MANQRSSTRDDFDRIKDAAHKLRAENRRLRKTNALLRKQLNQIGDIELDRQIEEENIDDSITVPEETTEKDFCPKCRSTDVKVVPAGKYRIRICTCGYRKRFEV